MTMVFLMKTTKSNVLSFVRKQLGSNKVWAVKALVRIYTENQTENEKVIEATAEDNGIGFSGTDGKFLSSLAKQIINGRNLSDKQMSHVFRLLPKYARQVVAFSNIEKLNSMVENFVEVSCECEEARRFEEKAYGKA
jgi:hypothetical protein